MDMNFDEQIRFLLTDRMSGVYGQGTRRNNSGLLDLVNRINPAKVSMVEIGCHRGVSTRFFASRFEKVTTVDIWGIGLPSPTKVYRGGITSEWSEIEADARRNLAGLPNVDILKMDSLAACPRFAEGSLGFVYIDGDHSHDGVSRDIVGWCGKIEPGGFIGGHDYPGRGCRGVVDQFMADNGLELELFSDCSWLAAIQRRIQ